jgi:RNA polymerase-binding transcription factor
VPAARKFEQFRKILESRIAEGERTMKSVERDRRATSMKHADNADEAAAEFERQNLTFKATAARQLLANLKQALERIRQGNFGECAECGSEIEPKRLEAIPWARHCLKCQEVREQQVREQQT